MIDMNAKVVSFRRGRHNQHTNQFLLEVDGIDSKEKATKLLGTKVVWKSSSGKEIVGKVTALHGNKGTVRARFNRGLPGQAIGSNVVLEKN